MMSDKNSQLRRRTVLASGAALGGAVASMGGVRAAGHDETERYPIVLREDTLREQLVDAPADPVEAIDLYADLLFDDEDDWTIQERSVRTAASGEPEYPGVPEGASVPRGPYASETQVAPQATTQANYVDLFEEIKVGEVPDHIPQVGGDDITVGINAEVKLTGIPGGALELIVGVGSVSASIVSVQIGKLEGTPFCVSAPVKGVAQVEACLSGTIDDDGDIDFGIDLSICAPKNDPCPWVSCQFCIGPGIDCGIQTDGDSASIGCGY